MKLESGAVKAVLLLIGKQKKYGQLRRSCGSDRLPCYRPRWTDGTWATAECISSGDDPSRKSVKVHLLKH